MSFSVLHLRLLRHVQSRSPFSVRSGAPSHPPSFPTRRSSDLALAAAVIAVAASLLAAACSTEEDVIFGDRSEEHTSELQSPCNLVCRLLLEKKNNDKTVGESDLATRSRRRWKRLRAYHP